MDKNDIPAGNEHRDAYEVISEFEAFGDQEEGYAPAPRDIPARNLVFADLNAWRGKWREGTEIVKFFFGISRFYVALATFASSTRKTTVEEFNKKRGVTSP
jgi:hypothetical protein